MKSAHLLQIAGQLVVLLASNTGSAALCPPCFGRLNLLLQVEVAGGELAGQQLIRWQLHS